MEFAIVCTNADGEDVIISRASLPNVNASHLNVQSWHGSCLAAYFTIEVLARKLRTGLSVTSTDIYPLPDNALHHTVTAGRVRVNGRTAYAVKIMPVVHIDLLA
jgi:hypothetical protein